MRRRDDSVRRREVEEERSRCRHRGLAELVARVDRKLWREVAVVPIDEPRQRERESISDRFNSQRRGEDLQVDRNLGDEEVVHDSDIDDEGVPILHQQGLEELDDSLPVPISRPSSL